MGSCISTPIWKSTGLHIDSSKTYHIMCTTRVYFGATCSMGNYSSMFLHLIAFEVNQPPYDVFVLVIDSLCLVAHNVSSSYLHYCCYLFFSWTIWIEYALCLYCVFYWWDKVSCILKIQYQCLFHVQELDFFKCSDFIFRKQIALLSWKELNLSITVS